MHASGQMSSGGILDTLLSITGRMNGFLYRCRNDDAYTMLYISDGIESISGYPANDVLGNRVRTFSSLIHPDDEESIRIAIDAALEKRGNWAVDYRVISKQGKPTWVHEIGGGVFNPAGELEFLEGFIIDIETRKKAEVYRETTQRLLASVFGVVTEPLAVADNAGKLIMANTAVTRRLGWSIFDLMGKPVTNMIAQADRAHLTEVMSAGAALDQTLQVKCFLLCKEKPDAAGEIELTTIRQPDGSSYHVVMLRAVMQPAAVDKEWGLELAVRDALKGDDGGAPVVAGKLQLVGLEAVRESLGEKWPAMAERAMVLAERTIQKHLRPGDIFRRSADEGFLVLFSHLSPTEAQFKANAIATEILEKLTGEIPELSEARVSSIASSVIVKEEEAKSEETIIEAIERRLQAARDLLELTSKETLTRGLKSGKALAAPVITDQNAATPITLMRMPAKLREAADILRSLGQIGYDLETETFLLANAAERVLAGLTRSANELIVTPVSLATLSHARTLEAWLHVARTLGATSKHQLVVEVQGISLGVPQTRLTDLVMRIASLFKSVAFEIPAIDPTFVGSLPVAVKLTTFQFDRIPWTSVGQPAPAFCKLVRALDVRQRRLIVKDVTSPTKQAALAKIGVSLFLHPVE